MRRRGAALLIATMLLWAAAPAALAHHSYAAFDETKTVTLHGTVKKWDWRNPHAFLVIVARMPDGSVQEWSLETLTIALLTRVGLTKDSMATGDEVMVVFHPHMTEKQFGALIEVDLPNGKSVLLTGQNDAFSGPGGGPAPGSPPEGPGQH